MEVNEKNIKTLTWDFLGLGKFEATIVDGKLTDFRACEHGSLVESGNAIMNNNPEFLRCVRDVITELLNALGGVEKYEFEDFGKAVASINLPQIKQENVL